MVITKYEYAWEGNKDVTQKDGYLVCRTNNTKVIVEVWGIKLESFKEFNRLFDHFRACTNNGKTEAWLDARRCVEGLLSEINLLVCREHL